mmetsp:Transcript_443/g.953  ORF Transcript_443/g.953 Transcript_443/m.953 type:complete len:319 (-) Transcript_443:521-1477(-)
MASGDSLDILLLQRRDPLLEALGVFFEGAHPFLGKLLLPHCVPLTHLEADELLGEHRQLLLLGRSLPQRQLLEAGREGGRAVRCLCQLQLHLLLLCSEALGALLEALGRRALQQRFTVPVHDGRVLLLQEEVLRSQLRRLLLRHRVRHQPLAVSQTGLSSKLRAIQLPDPLLQTLLLSRHVHHQRVVPGAKLVLLLLPNLRDPVGHVVISLEEDDAAFGLDKILLHPHHLCRPAAPLHLLGERKELLESAGRLACLQVRAVLLLVPLADELGNFGLQARDPPCVLLVQQHLLDAEDAKVLLVARQLLSCCGQLLLPLA